MALSEERYGPGRRWWGLAEEQRRQGGTRHGPDKQTGTGIAGVGGSGHRWSPGVGLEKKSVVCAFREHAPCVSFQLLRGPSARCYVPLCRSSIAVAKGNQERTVGYASSGSSSIDWQYSSAWTSVWILWTARTKSRSVLRDRGNIADERIYVVDVVTLIYWSTLLGPSGRKGKGRKYSY